MHPAIILLIDTITTLLSIISLVILTYHVIVYREGKNIKDDEEHKRLTQYPQLTIIIPVKREPIEIINQSMRGLSKQTYPKEKIQLIIVSDDKKEDFKKIREKIIKGKIEIELYRREKQTGYKAGAINYALPKSKGEYIIILDSDAVVEERYLEKAISYLENRKDVDALATCWKPLNQKNTPISEAQSVSLNYLTTVFYKSRKNGKGPIIAPGSGCIFRRTALNEIGGLNERCLAEDVELSVRLLLAGKRIEFLEDAKIYVENPETYEVFKRQQARWIYGTDQVFLSQLKGILKAKIPLKWKLGLLIHLSQYQALLINIVLSTISAASLIAKQDLMTANSIFAPIFTVILALMALSYYDAATKTGLKPKDCIINMGRCTAIVSSLAHIVILQNIKAILKIKEGWYITPKGKKKKKPKNKSITELILGTLGITTSIILLINQYMISAWTLFTMSLPYIYVGIKTALKKW